MLLVALTGCARARPCEPWVGWQLTALSDSPGERLEVCTPTQLQWRIIPGGTPEAWLARLQEMRPDGGWRLWRQRSLVRPLTVAVDVEVRPDGDDLVITLRPDPSVDVPDVLRALDGR